MAHETIHLLNTLRTLGLSDKEARIYLSLLQLGPATPYKMAKRSGLKRPTAYVIADELVEKGCAVKAPGEKHTYIARPPEVIYGEHEAKMLEAKKTLPELQALKGGVADRPGILYFEGLDGFKRALMYKLDEVHDIEVVGFYANPDFLTKESVALSAEMNQRWIDQNISVRGILTESETLKAFEDFMKESSVHTKIIPKDLYNSNASFEFYPNFIKILFFDTSMGLVIESPTVAKAMRQIFELLWARLGNEYGFGKIVG